ncbi:hypothetical protein NL676_022835 [Syzygium grande]|nr:hypothetical protein NL676_022835 [Syzygium grande]
MNAYRSSLATEEIFQILRNALGVDAYEAHLEWWTHEGSSWNQNCSLSANEGDTVGVAVIVPVLILYACQREGGGGEEEVQLGQQLGAVVVSSKQMGDAGSVN